MQVSHTSEQKGHGVVHTWSNVSYLGVSRAKSPRGGDNRVCHDSGLLFFGKVTVSQLRRISFDFCEIYLKIKLS